MIIHSPLVGPSTVAPLATALEALGWTTTVPDLRTASNSPAHFEQRAVNAADATEIVIGHSGAGPFIPTIGEATNAAALLFVDAVDPLPGPLYTTSKQLLQLLDALPVVEGRLPPWHEWWPAELMAELVPDQLFRRRITDEIPQVPRSFYDSAIPTPSRWWTRPAAYLQLSPAYELDRAQAELWDWPTSQVDGRHLDVCARPQLVAEHVSELVHRLAL